MARARSHLCTVSLLCFAVVLCLWLFDGKPLTTAFADATPDAAPKRTLMSYVPLYSIIQGGHTGYPVPMMFGFICRGNIELRKACGGNPYPTWIIGFFVGIACYVYPGNVLSDALFTPGVLRGLSNNNIFMCHVFWFLVIQNSQKAYDFLITKHVNIFITVWFLMDATHASLCFLERSVTPPLGNPVFARGVFQCFVWCGAAGILQCGEKAMRGVPIPKLDAIIPNSMDVLGNPVIFMWWNMFIYYLIMIYLTDCDIFAKDGKPAVQCGVDHPDLYAAFHYIPMAAHVFRAYRPSLFPAKK